MTLSERLPRGGLPGFIAKEACLYVGTRGNKSSFLANPVFSINGLTFLSIF